VAIVRVLLFAALAAIAAALLLYAVKRDRRYLRFVAQVVKFTIIGLLAILLAFAVQRIFGISLGEVLRTSTSSSSPRTSLPAPQRLPELAVG
jgi:H+/Cl- antiporter ClcA